MVNSCFVFTPRNVPDGSNSCERALSGRICVYDASVVTDGRIPLQPPSADPLAWRERACAVRMSAFRSRAVWTQRARLHRSPAGTVDEVRRLSAAVVGASWMVSAAAAGREASGGALVCPAAGVNTAAGKVSARSTSVQFLPQFIRRTPMTVRSDGAAK